MLTTRFTPRLTQSGALLLAPLLLAGGSALAQTTLTVKPRVAPVTVLTTQQFTTTVNVKWYVDGVLSGNGTVGVISASGVYTPPALVGKHQIKAVSLANPSVTGAAKAIVVDYPGTFTQHNDNARTGQNLQEVVLNPANVNATRFGKLFSYAVDDQVFAAPLYVENVNVSGSFHNVVYVVTEKDSVFAFDADGKQSAPLWQVSFINPTAGIATVSSSDVSCLNIWPDIGITGTPVIDRNSGTMYLVARTKENGVFVQRLHALDLSTGSEMLGGPVVIQASVAASSGTVSFNPLTQNQRAALLLENGTVYIAWASHCDNQPYHGWVLGYDAATLAQTAVFNTTPTGSRAGIWQMGGGLAADASGMLYAATGNGSFDVNTGGNDYGTGVLKVGLGPNGFGALDYFAPSNESTLNKNDWEMGSAGVLLLPDQAGAHPHLLMAGSKTGMLYLLDRDSLGGFRPSDHVVQEFKAGVASSLCCDAGFWSSPAYWNQNIYTAGKQDVVKMFGLNNGMLTTTPISHGSTVMPGEPVTISANSLSNGIAWVVQTDKGIVHAYDATDLARELYNSNQHPTRDALPNAWKYTEAVVANGRVYIATKTNLVVYGLLP